MGRFYPGIDARPRTSDRPDGLTNEELAYFEMCIPYVRVEEDIRENRMDSTTIYEQAMYAYQDEGLAKKLQAQAFYREQRSK